MCSSDLGVRADEDFAGDASFGPEALEQYNGLRLRWFDQWLKGMDTGVAEEPPVKIFVMGGGSGKKIYDVLGLNARIDHGGRWRFESQWPIAALLSSRASAVSRGTRPLPWLIANR